MDPWKVEFSTTAKAAPAGGCSAEEAKEEEVINGRALLKEGVPGMSDRSAVVREISDK